MINYLLLVELKKNFHQGEMKKDLFDTLLMSDLITKHQFQKMVEPGEICSTNPKQLTKFVLCLTNLTWLIKLGLHSEGNKL